MNIGRFVVFRCVGFENERQSDAAVTVQIRCVHINVSLGFGWIGVELDAADERDNVSFGNETIVIETRKKEKNQFVLTLSPP